MFKRIYPGCKVVVCKETKRIYIVKKERNSVMITDDKILDRIIDRHFMERDE